MIPHHFSKFINQQHCSPSEEFELIAYKLSELVESGSSCLDLSALEIPHSNEEWIDFLHRDQKESAVGSPGTTHPLILTNSTKETQGNEQAQASILSGIAREQISKNNANHANNQKNKNP